MVHNHDLERSASSFEFGVVSSKGRGGGHGVTLGCIRKHTTAVTRQCMTGIGPSLVDFPRKDISENAC